MRRALGAIGWGILAVVPALCVVVAIAVAVDPSQRPDPVECVRLPGPAVAIAAITRRANPTLVLAIAGRLATMTSNGEHRLARAEKNEEAFKQHNERRAAFEDDAGYGPDEPVPFVCECDDPACAHAVELPLGEYEHAVAPPDQFVVLPGHEDPSVERIIDEHPGYLVVSKPDLKRR